MKLNPTAAAARLYADHADHEAALAAPRLDGVTDRTPGRLLPGAPRPADHAAPLPVTVIARGADTDSAHGRGVDPYDPAHLGHADGPTPDDVWSR